MAAFPVVLDANVLYGVFTTDILITLAGPRTYRAHWTQRIVDEAERNVIKKRPDLDPAAVKRRFEAMNAAMPEAMLEPPPTELVAAMTNHEGDRHVLATATSVNAVIIVTENTRHFPPAACRPHGIETRTLDEFITDFVAFYPSAVWRSIETMSARRTNPPMTPKAVCEVLERYIPTALDALTAAGFPT